MASLPPVPEEGYRSFRADQFGQTATKDLGLLEWRDQAEGEIDQLEQRARQEESFYQRMTKAPARAPAGSPTPLGAAGASGPRRSGVEQHRAAVQAAFGDLGPEQVDTMLAVMERESGGDPGARKNDEVEDSQGVFQINTRAHPDLAAKYDLSDPYQNALAARSIYDSQGIGAWHNAATQLGIRQGGTARPSGAGRQAYSYQAGEAPDMSSAQNSGQFGAARDDWYKDAQDDLARLEAVDDRPPSEYEPPTAGSPGRPPDADLSQFDPSQGLSTAEAYSACGPAAAVRFAQMHGRNPTLREAVTLAREFGWNEQAGMAGPKSQAALMQAMVPDAAVRLEENPDAERVAQDAMSGNVVTLSTRAHYYTVSGYDPRTEKLYVGKSGTDRKGGSEWMSLDEIRKLDGSVAALFVDSPLAPAPSVATEEPGTDWFTKATGELERLEAGASTGSGVGGGWDDRNGSRRLTRDQPLDEALTDSPAARIASGFIDAGRTIKSGVDRVNDWANARADEARAATIARQADRSGRPADEVARDYDRTYDLASTFSGEPLHVARGALRAVRGLEPLADALGQPGLSLQVVPRSADPDLARIQAMYDEPPTPPRLGAVADRLETARRDFVRAWTDRGVDLAEFQKRAQQALGRPLTADEMAYEASRLNADMGAKVRVDEQLKPIIQQAGDDYGYVRDYLTARGNLDVAAAMGNARRAFSGGLDAAASQRALDAMQTELGPQRFAKVQDLATRVADVNRDLLQAKVDAGLITPAQYADWTAKYPTYTPVKITDYLKAQMAGGSGAGQSLSVRSNGIRVLSEEGTSRLREDPIASTLRNAYETESLVRKNDAFNAFAKLRDADPALQAQIREVPAGYTATRDEQTVTGFVGGERKTFVMPKDMAAVVKQEGVAPVPVLGPLMQLFKMAVTSRNPVFLAGNAVNDAVSYAVRTASREGGPQHVPGALVDLARAYVDAFSGLLSGEFRGDAARFLKEGGGQFGFFNREEKNVRQGVDALRRSTVFSVDGADDLKRLIGGVLTLKPVEAIGERIELAPRVAAFRRAEARGQNTVQAVLEGRTVTVDFAQGGAWAKQLNGFIPFFNVATQAAATAPRAVAENPRGAALTALGLLVAPTVAAEAWNRSDPQRAADYADVPDYLKDQGIVLMLPGEAPRDERGERRPQFVHLKMRDYAPYTTLVRGVAERVLGDDHRAWASLLGSAGAQVAPVGGVDSLLPPGVSTGVELATNRDLFRGRDIATDRNDENASALSRGLADAINAGAQRIGRYPDVRPSQVEFAGRDVGGGVVAAGLAASDLATGRTKGSTTPQDLPGAGGLVGRFVRGDTGQQAQTARDRRLSDETRQLLYDAGLTPDVSAVKGEIDGAPLSRVEQAEYQRVANALMDDAIQAASMRGAWLTGDEAARKKIVQDAVAKAHERARAQIKREIGSGELGLRRASEADRRAARR